MKVVRLHFGVNKVERLYHPGFNGNHAILVLQNASYQQKRMMNNHSVVFLKKLRRDDYVGNARFVFETQKDESFGSTGALANNYGAGNRHKLAIR